VQRSMAAAAVRKIDNAGMTIIDRFKAKLHMN
jgi:hypothetical protein